MRKTELVVVGGGNMGEALLRGVLRTGLLSQEELAAAEPRSDRREALSRELGIEVVPTVSHAPPSPRYLLAVKPQQMEAAAAELGRSIGEAGALVLSIAAGVSTAYLAGRLGVRARLLRAMPNTPMLVGCGCTGLAAGAGATSEDVEFARKLFEAGGKVLLVEEQAMDAVTAVSGSGPAYFFYLIEAMVAAGVAEGLSEGIATALATQTCAGAAALLAASGEQPAELRAKVTSPGGTTQAAIASMEAAGVRRALVAGVRAAAARSRELGK